MRRARLLATAVTISMTCIACATRQPVGVDQPVRGLDRKLSTYAYIEEGTLMTLIVGTHVARDKDGAAYMPIEIALANRGVRRLTLSRESFTLIDKDGTRYPMATTRELIQGYDALDFDRNLIELPGIVFNRFAALQNYPSQFTPIPNQASVVRDRMSLPKHGYILDLIYFPAPATGVRDQAFELHVDAPELEDPVFVKFEVR